MCVFNNEYNSLIFTLYYISLSQSLALTLTISHYLQPISPILPPPPSKIIIVRLHVIPESQMIDSLYLIITLLQKIPKCLRSLPVAEFKNDINLNMLGLQ